MSKIKYRIKEYEECDTDYRTDENNRNVIPYAYVKKQYRPQIYEGWWFGWVNLVDYSYNTEVEALRRIENHKKAMSVTLDNKTRYIDVD